VSLLCAVSEALELNRTLIFDDYMGMYRCDSLHAHLLLFVSTCANDLCAPRGYLCYLESLRKFVTSDSSCIYCNLKLKRTVISDDHMGMDRCDQSDMQRMCYSISLVSLCDIMFVWGKKGRWNVL
jgi:hypothetical protein